MKIQKVIAKNLRAERERLSLTRDSLAKMAGVTPQTIYDIENENRNPSITVLDSLANSLGLTAKDLLNDSEPLPVKSLPVSKVLQKMMAVPDEVYEVAIKLGANDPIWEEEIIPLLAAAVEDQEIALEEERKKNSRLA